MELEKRIGSTKIIIKKGDITKEKVDAIVNAANSRLLGGGGVDGAIHRAAGPTLLEECKRIGWCEPGDAVVTDAGNLSAKYVIHTVGPIWRGGTRGEENTLKNAYISSLKRAMEKKVRTISFPAISTGAYGFPIDLAAKITLLAIKEFLEKNPHVFDEVRLVLFNDKVFNSFKEALERYLK